MFGVLHPNDTIQTGRLSSGMAHAKPVEIRRHAFVTRPISISYPVVVPDKRNVTISRYLRPQTSPPAIREVVYGMERALDAAPDVPSRLDVPAGRVPRAPDACRRPSSSSSSRTAPTPTTCGRCSTRARRGDGGHRPCSRKRARRSFSTLGQWGWDTVDDEVDLGHHVRRDALPRPGGEAELMALVLAAARHPARPQPPAVGDAPDRGPRATAASRSTPRSTTRSPTASPR